MGSLDDLLGALQGEPESPSLTVGFPVEALQAQVTFTLPDLVTNEELLAFKARVSEVLNEGCQYGHIETREDLNWFLRELGLEQMMGDYRVCMQVTFWVDVSASDGDAAMSEVNGWSQRQIADAVAIEASNHNLNWDVTEYEDAD